MSANVKVKLDGMKKLDAALRKLPRELSKTVEQSALRDGMKPVLSSAKGYAAASADSGLLAQSLRLNVRRRKGAKVGVGMYGARVGANAKVSKRVIRVVKGKTSGGATRVWFKEEIARPAKYAHFVELGTSRVPARPFLRPAVSASRSAMLAGLAIGYARGLKRVVKKIRSTK